MSKYEWLCSHAVYESDIQAFNKIYSPRPAVKDAQTLALFVIARFEFAKEIKSLFINDRYISSM